MDLKSILIKSPDRNKIIQLIDYVDDNKSLFNQLISIYLAGPYRVTHFASHVIEGCVKAHPALVNAHLKVLIKSMQKLRAHDSEIRNTIRLLQFIEVPESIQGKVVEVCFKFLLDKKKANAIRVFSLSVLHKNIKDSPELQRELRLIMEDEMPFATPAFRSRANKVLKELKV